MKPLLALVLTLFISQASFGKIDTVIVKSKITDVTVFFAGAQITRQASLNLKKGKYLIRVEKLPHEIRPASIQVEGIKDCKILSVKHQLNYQDQNKKGKEELALEDKMKAEELRIKEIKNKLIVFDLEEKLLLDNSNFGRKDNGASVSEIKEAAEFYRLRLNEIKQGKLKLSLELEEANKNIQQLYSEINKFTTSSRKMHSLILIAIECEKDIAATMNVNYYIVSAGWEPLYDFRVDDVTKPMAIVYNANVFQSTGEDWVNANIKLSSNNPSLIGNKPELNTWYIERGVNRKTGDISQGPSAIKGRVLDSNSKEALAFANVEVYQGNVAVTGTTTDFDGQFTIKPISAGTYNLKVSYVGYTPMQINNVRLHSDKTTFQDVNLRPAAIALQEVVAYEAPLIQKDKGSSGSTITREEIAKMPGRSVSNVAQTVGGVYSRDDGLNVRGSRDDANYYYIDGVKKAKEIETSNFISNSLKTSVANLEYTIDIPYTIHSDGEDYSLKIKEVKLPVNYKYHSVPKLDGDAFLTAEIPDWNQLNLLSGKSSIYYQGTFTGESYIDVNSASDTLSLSLGRDKNIIVKREVNKEIIDKRIIGNNVKETIGLDVTVKNNKNSKVSLIIDDQYPISEKKSIEVELLESSNAKVDQKTGKLVWEIQLEPNEKKVLNYKYSVKYPKYVNLAIE